MRADQSFSVGNGTSFEDRSTQRAGEGPHTLRDAPGSFGLHPEQLDAFRRKYAREKQVQGQGRATRIALIEPPRGYTLR
jgi:hypothetical protein